MVESANARIKRWKYLDRVLPTNQVPHIGDFVRIVCAIINKYSPPLCSQCTETQTQMALHMKTLAKEVNSLQAEVEAKDLDKRSRWRPMEEADFEGFPRLDEDQLRSLTCGVYQLRLSPYYAKEHIDDGSNLTIHLTDSGLMRVRIQSRHVSARQYTLWVRYNNTDILAWYCRCRAGARVVGMCAHIAAVIWFLGFAKNRYVGGNYGVHDWGQYLADASDLPENVDESDTDSD